MAIPGMPEPGVGGDDRIDPPPGPMPGERPLGSDEPSAPFDEPFEPGIEPDRRPGTSTIGKAHA